MNKQELAFAAEKGSPSYIPSELEILHASEKVQLIEGEGLIGETIRYALTGAHSPYHQVFWIEEDGKTIFFGADDAPQLQQMKSRFVAKYDYDGKKSMQLRTRWWEQGANEHWTFLFYHDIKSPAISL